MVFWDVGVGLVILWKFGAFVLFYKSWGFIHNKPRCMFGIKKNGMIVESLMKMGPKGWNGNYGKWPNYIV